MQKIFFLIIFLNVSLIIYGQINTDRTALLDKMKMLNIENISDSEYLVKMVALRHNYSSSLFADDVVKRSYSEYLSGIVSDMAKTNIEGFAKYIVYVTDERIKARLLNYAAKTLFDKKTNLTTAESFSKSAGIQMMKLIDSSKKNHHYRSKIQSGDSDLLSNYLDLYASILFEQGKQNEASKYQEIAVSYNPRQSEVNQHYLTYLLKENKNKEAMKALTAFVRNGGSILAIDSVSKIIYSNVHET